MRWTADHFARVGADQSAAQDLAVAVFLRGIIKLQRGDTFVAANQAVAQSPTEVLMPKQTL